MNRESKQRNSVKLGRKRSRVSKNQKETHLDHLVALFDFAALVRRRLELDAADDVDALVGRLDQHALHQPAPNKKKELGKRKIDEKVREELVKLGTSSSSPSKTK